MPRKSPSSKNNISSLNNSKSSKSSSNSNRANKLNKSTGGVNLTPLISALLLAGIKLSLEQNKKTKKVASKSTKTASKPKQRPKTF